MRKPKLTTILRNLQDEFSKILGEKLDTILLFGSQARGDARVDSDIDVLVVIRGDFDYGDLIKRTSGIVSELSLQNDITISRAFISKEHFEHDQNPFLLNVRREGIRI
jgi:predicted nucleotidyltransferase